MKVSISFHKGIQQKKKNQWLGQMKKVASRLQSRSQTNQSQTSCEKIKQDNSQQSGNMIILSQVQKIQIMMIQNFGKIGMAIDKLNKRIEKVENRVQKLQYKSQQYLLDQSWDQKFKSLQNQYYSINQKEKKKINNDSQFTKAADSYIF